MYQHLQDGHSRVLNLVCAFNKTLQPWMMKFWFNTCRDFRPQPLDHTKFHKCVTPYLYMYIIYSYHFGIGLYIDHFVNNHIVKQQILN